MGCFTGGTRRHSLISHILHQRMMPAKQAFDDEGDMPDLP
jgi:hypothetical protein